MSKKTLSNKALIIRLSSMGDVVLTSHTIRVLANRFPNTEFHFLTAKPFVEIVKYNPHISKVIEYDKSSSQPEILSQKKEIFNSNGKKRYDLVIDLQNNLRSWIFRRGLGEFYFCVPKNRLHKLSLVHLQRPILNDEIRIPLVYLKAVEQLEVSDDGGALELWLPEERDLGYYPPDCFKESLSPEIKIAVAPGATYFTKRWQEEKFAELINTLESHYSAEIYMVGGVPDIDIVKRIIAASSTKALDYSGSTSKIETARVISKCNLLISNDTGVMHIAAARRVPTVAIFGSSVKQLGFAPFRVKNIVVENNEISCRPCSHIGKTECPKKHFKCMADISVKQVLNAAEMLM